MKSFHDYLRQLRDLEAISATTSRPIGISLAARKELVEHGLVKEADMEDVGRCFYLSRAGLKKAVEYVESVPE